MDRLLRPCILAKAEPSLGLQQNSLAVEPLQDFARVLILLRNTHLCVHHFELNGLQNHVTDEGNNLDILPPRYAIPRPDSASPLDQVNLVGGGYGGGSNSSSSALSNFGTAFSCSFCLSRS